MLYEPPARRRVELQTPGELGNALRFGGIELCGWYPVAWYRDLWRAVHDLLGADELAANRIGQRSAGLALGDVHHALACMLPKTKLVALATRTFETYFEGAHFVTTWPEPNCIVAHWRYCRGFDSMIWSAVAGGLQYFLEAGGVARVHLAVTDGGGNADHMTATVSWV